MSTISTYTPDAATANLTDLLGKIQSQLKSIEISTCVPRLVGSLAALLRGWHARRHSGRSSCLVGPPAVRRSFGMHLGFIKQRLLRCWRAGVTNCCRDSSEVSYDGAWSILLSSPNNTAVA